MWQISSLGSVRWVSSGHPPEDESDGITPLSPRLAPSPPVSPYQVLGLASFLHAQPIQQWHSSHLSTRVPSPPSFRGSGSFLRHLARRLLLCQKTRYSQVSRKGFEHIKPSAKLLDYFLRSNKSNINQNTPVRVRIPRHFGCIPSPLHSPPLPSPSPYLPPVSCCLSALLPAWVHMLSIFSWNNMRWIFIVCNLKSFECSGSPAGGVCAREHTKCTCVLQLLWKSGKHVFIERCLAIFNSFWLR